MRLLPEAQGTWPTIHRGASIGHAACLAELGARWRARPRTERVLFFSLSLNLAPLPSIILHSAAAPWPPAPGADDLTPASLASGYATCYAASGVAREEETWLSLAGGCGEVGAAALRSAAWSAVSAAAAARAVTAPPPHPPWPGPGVAWGVPLPKPEVTAPRQDKTQPPPSKSARSLGMAAAPTATPGLYRRSLIASLLASRPHPEEALSTIIAAYAARHPLGRDGDAESAAGARAAAWGAHLAEALSEGLERLRTAGRRRGVRAGDDSNNTASASSAWLYLTRLAAACGRAGLLPAGCLAGWAACALAVPDPAGLVGAALLPLVTVLVAEAPHDAGGVGGLGLGGAGSLLTSLAARGGGGGGGGGGPPLAPVYAALAARLAATVPTALVLDGDRIALPPSASSGASSAAGRAARALAAAAAPPALALDPRAAAAVLTGAAARGDAAGALGDLLSAMPGRPSGDGAGGGRPELLPSRRAQAAVAAALDWGAASTAAHASSSSTAPPFAARVLAAAAGGALDVGAAAVAAWVEAWAGADAGAPGRVAVAAVAGGAACPVALVRRLGRPAAAGGPACPATAAIQALHPIIVAEPAGRGFAAARRAALRAAGAVGVGDDDEGGEAVAAAVAAAFSTADTGFDVSSIRALPPAVKAAVAAAVAARLESEQVETLSSSTLLRAASALDAAGGACAASALAARLLSRLAAPPVDPALPTTLAAACLARHAALAAGGGLGAALDSLTGDATASPVSWLAIDGAAALLERYAGSEQMAAWLAHASGRPGWDGLSGALGRAGASTPRPAPAAGVGGGRAAAGAAPSIPDLERVPDAAIPDPTTDPASLGRALVAALSGGGRGGVPAALVLATSLRGGEDGPAAALVVEAGLVAAARAVGPDPGGALLASAAARGLADPVRAAAALAVGGGWLWLPRLLGPTSPPDAAAWMDAALLGTPWTALWAAVGPALAAAAAGAPGAAAATAALTTHPTFVSALTADPPALASVLAALPLPPQAGTGTVAGRIAAALVTRQPVRPAAGVDAAGAAADLEAAAVAAAPCPLLRSLVEEVAVLTGGPGVPPSVAVGALRAALAREEEGIAGVSGGCDGAFLPSAARRLVGVVVRAAAAAPDAAAGAASVRVCLELGPAMAGALLEGLLGGEGGCGSSPGWPAAVLACLAAAAPAGRVAAAGAVVRALQEAAAGGGEAGSTSALLAVLTPLLPLLHASRPLREGAAAGLVGLALRRPAATTQAERAAFLLAALARPAGPPAWAGGGPPAGPLATAPALAARVASAVGSRAVSGRQASRLLAALGRGGSASVPPAAAWRLASTDPAVPPPPWLVEVGAVPLPRRPPTYV